MIPFDRFLMLSSVNNTRGHSAKIVKHYCHLDIRRHFFCESHRSVEQSISASHKFNQCQHLQGLSEQTSSQQDGLLHGLDVRLALWPHLVPVHGSGAAAPAGMLLTFCLYSVT